MRILWVLGVCLWAAGTLPAFAAEVRQAPARELPAAALTGVSGRGAAAGGLSAARLPAPFAPDLPIAGPTATSLALELPQPLAPLAGDSAHPEPSMRASAAKFEAAVPIAGARADASPSAGLPAAANAAAQAMGVPVPASGQAGAGGAEPALESRLDGFFDGERSVPPSRVALLETPMEAIDARAAMIMSANRSIDAGYFAFFPDAAGLAKLALLREAARRGRRVRLVLDPWGNKLPKAMLRHLQDEGIQIRFYHPYRADRLSWLWRRSHDKWTIVDGEEAILGDRNMGKHYFGMGRAPWTSREAYVAGPAARQAQDYADRMWDSREMGRPRGLDRVPAAEAAEQGSRLDVYAQHFEWRKTIVDYSLKPWADRARVAPARFSANALGRPGRVPGTGRDLLEMIRNARQTIVIENAYVVLPKVFRKELERAIRERGVRVVLVTNSYATNNLLSVRHAYEADVPGLVAMGVELYEFKGPGTLHAKTMVVDGDRSYVGSFNLDPRSFRFNTETGVIVEGALFAGDLLTKIEASRRGSTLVGWRGRWLSPRRPWPVVSLIWGLLRRLLLALLRDQV